MRVCLFRAGQGTRQGVVSLPAAPVTWNKSSVVEGSCDCVCVPPLSCDLSSGQGLRSAESLSEVPSTQGTDRH